MGNIDTEKDAEGKASSLTRLLVSLPVCLLRVDCRSTLCGETQRTIDDTKKKEAEGEASGAAAESSPDTTRPSGAPGPSVSSGFTGQETTFVG